MIGSDAERKIQEEQTNLDLWNEAGGNEYAYVEAANNTGSNRYATSTENSSALPKVGNFLQKNLINI